jgi:hypothetical protein
MAEVYLAYFYKLITRLLGKKIILNRVNFVGPMPENTCEHKRLVADRTPEAQHL